MESSGCHGTRGFRCAWLIEGAPRHTGIGGRSLDRRVTGRYRLIGCALREPSLAETHQTAAAPNSHLEAAPPAKSEGVTALLRGWSGGDQTALERLLRILYDDLHRQAVRALRRERDGHTLQPTALINEAYLRLVKHDRVQWHNRAQFLGVAAQVIRRVLVDYERNRRAIKRGGHQTRVTLEECDATASHGAANVEMLALHDALERLAKFRPLYVRIVELRYFAGLSIEETAAALGIAPITVKRKSEAAYAWLRAELDGA